VHDRIYKIAAPIDGVETVHLYLLVGPRPVLIDSGVVDTPTVHVSEGLRRFGLGLSDVTMVLNTHAHFDHAGGNAALHAHGVKIAAHPRERARLASREYHVEHARRGLELWNLEHELLPARRSRLMRLNGPVADVDVWLEDGDRIDLGDGEALTVVHTPGHTHGSCSFIWESEGVILTGDSVEGFGSHGPGQLPILEVPSLYGRMLRTLEPAFGQAQMLLGAHPFRDRDSILGPVVRGSSVKDLIAGSLQIHEGIAEHTRAAVERFGDDGVGALHWVLKRLEKDFGVIAPGGDLLPAGAAVTLPAYWRWARHGDEDTDY
jgi:glyoxylase-like metal-dependent hydrolase (beta-lactamase superfamily II)